MGVLRMEDWVSIKNLRAKNSDLGTRKIAELLGVSRNTVKKALASEDAPKYRSTTPAINKLPSGNLLAIFSRYTS